jgi:serine-type D-Ala-D-Ala carboxypeptidase (penicillin-binding protein 5/6)
MPIAYNTCKILPRLFFIFFLFFAFIIQNAFAVKHQHKKNTKSLITTTNTTTHTNSNNNILNLDVKAYILIDANSGCVLAEKNADQILSPASLTKIMTLYLVAQSLNNGKIHLTDMVNVSEDAWRASGSRMFIRVGTTVAVKDLISGIATASGNDATVAISEHLAGTEASFAALMNQTAKSLGMNNTNFIDSNGLSASNHYSTARDLAILSKAWITNFPEYYSWFKEKWMTYNNIKQPNRNRLLWRDPSVDGLKTGHTPEAGYCLVASAVRNAGMRLISVILGAKSDGARVKDTEVLLNYGFRFFETRKILNANTPIITSRIWLGKEKYTSFGLKDNLYITLPVGQQDKIKTKININNKLKAPIIKNAVYGTIDIIINNKIIASKPLIALQDNQKTNFVFALYDHVIMLFQK